MTRPSARGHKDNPVMNCLFFTIIVIVCWPTLAYQYARDSYRESDRLRRRQRRKELRPPAVKRRKVPGKEDDDDNKHVVHGQTQSALLRLPAEIRIMIWKDVLGHKKLYIITRDKVRVRVYRYTKAPILSIALTCKLIYRETIDLLYAQPKFLFEEIYDFLGFCAVVPFERWKHLQNIELDFSRYKPRAGYDNRPLDGPLSYVPIQHLSALCQLPHPSIEDDASSWSVACSLLSQLKHLRHLGIYLRWDSFQGTGWAGNGERRVLKEESKILGELDRVRVNGSFEVGVDWVPVDGAEGPGTGHAKTNVPFELKQFIGQR